MQNQKLLPALTSLNSSRNIWMDRSSSHLFLQALTVRGIAAGAELLFRGGRISRDCMKSELTH